MSELLEIELKAKNWQNCCQYQAGTWHGTWTGYASAGEVVKVVQVVTDLQLNSEGTEIHHTNYYTYEDGTKESKFYGIRTPENMRSLFLENTFSWGSEKLELNSTLFMEIGFRYEDQRSRLVTQYNSEHSLERITIIREKLNTPPNLPAQLKVNNLEGVWQGISQTMTPNLEVSQPIPLDWLGFNCAEHNQVFFYPDGISVSCPLQLQLGQSFSVAAGVLTHPNQYQRAIRQFNERGRFQHYTLETFTSKT